MAKGRPRQFDEAAALEAALEIFWLKGYERASCGELLQAMGIKCGSMYGAFGDKGQLFSKALALYADRMVAPTLARLSGPGSALENVREFVEGFRRLGSDADRKGCLITRLLVEGESAPPEAVERVRRLSRRLLDTLADALRRAESNGEFGRQSGRIDPDAMAATLVAVGQGLTVLARAGASSETINGVVDSALALLRVEAD